MKLLFTIIAAALLATARAQNYTNIVQAADIWTLSTNEPTSSGIFDTFGTNLASTNFISFHTVRTNVNTGESALTALAKMNVSQSNTVAAIAAIYSTPQFSGQVVTPSIALTNSYTPASCHDTTLGWPVGTIVADSNYVYRVEWTNAWGRAGWTTNGW